MLRPSTLLANDLVGWSVSLDGNFLAIGAPGTNGGASASGLAYMFDYGASWTASGVLEPATARADDHYGAAVVVARNAVAVGGFWEDGTTTMIDGPDTPGGATANRGAVYVYRRNSGVWGGVGYTHYVKPPTSDDADWFGASVAADGDTFAVGAYGEASGIVGNPMDNSAPRAGAVFVFR
jgi:hypothetical protein